MDKCIRNRDGERLLAKIVEACLYNRQSKFEVELYRYNVGVMGIPLQFSVDGVEPYKISSFLKKFGQQNKMECELIKKEIKDENYTMGAFASIKLPKTTVSDIENSEIRRNQEHENVIRKKVLDYYNKMNNYSLSKELRPLILNDVREVIKMGYVVNGIRNERVKACFVVTQNFIQVDPDYRSSYYSMYRYSEYSGQPLATPEMTALALVILDYVANSIEHEYSTQCVQRSIRVLNVGVEITIQVGVYFS